MPIMFMLSALTIHLPSLWSPTLNPLTRVGFLENIVYYTTIQTSILHALSWLGCTYNIKPYLDTRTIALHLIQDFVWQTQSWADRNTTLAPNMIRSTQIFNFVICLFYYGQTYKLVSSIYWTIPLSTHLVALCVTDFSKWCFIAFSSVALRNRGKSVVTPPLSIRLSSSR